MQRQLSARLMKSVSVSSLPATTYQSSRTCFCSPKRSFAHISTSSSSTSTAKSDENPSSDVKSMVSWIDTYLTRQVRPFARLARLDEPIGTWLLAWPCMWLKPLHQRSILYDPTPALYRLGMHVSSEEECSDSIWGGLWDRLPKRVTLQAQREYPPDMQCKDKFLLQSTTVTSNVVVDELPPDTFNKESGKVIEECKLRVVYISVDGNGEDEALKSSTRSLDGNSAVQRVKEERDMAVKQKQLLQQELEMLKRRRYRISERQHRLPLYLCHLCGIH